MVAVVGTVLLLRSCMERWDIAGRTTRCVAVGRCGRSQSYVRMQIHGRVDDRRQCSDRQLVKSMQTVRDSVSVCRTLDCPRPSSVQLRQGTLCSEQRVWPDEHWKTMGAFDGDWEWWRGARQTEGTGGVRTQRWQGRGGDRICSALF